MRKISLLLLMFLLFAGYGRVQAQAQPIDTITNLQVEIWPDYDQPSALVLMTGFLDTAPATVTMPLPGDATLNVVARVTADNSMIDDITVDQSVPGQITFTTPDPTFRVEYYMPYEVTDGERTMSFTWQANLTVDLLEVAVQQPTGASLMQTDPAAASVGSSTTDGFTYHVLGGTAVPAGETYSISVSYSNPGNILSVNAPPPASSGATTGTVDTVVPSATDSGFDWTLVGWIVGGIGAILVVAAVTWQIASRQGGGSRSSRQRKPRPQSRSAKEPRRPAKAKQARPKSDAASQTRFCTNCGNELTGKDKFCRECGTPVKSR